ncbi:cystathionine beta-lyase [Parageobacillus thermoglucosidasius]|uniref:cysteine-S-conjugate beta-lyase n=2 Tax=Anoxybacillaceae TaxID=3120669 RepID=A0AAN1D693_PARTM|nr:cystathionine beta-lyase [Parageobacillus thermoglucosidasius]KYD15432.1 Cystathionine beta-lyase [Anoxybacillus flavithermus]REK57863.1 MAG: cystathionine beta-lyase MetC [Geobacillus sp.]AEH48884.1 Cys/Met metabolism pyridoxal-phosphate-dependent protein [Parageobacillus thermoglucosidasius C56-YS93]ALF09873.1 cystathionine gamma-synthase [Parageobacillus thermoglucosidasius]ANZ29954.1 cystathionine gamma-synthase [Parageobacillus thermoglucosidasius]
MEQRVSFQTKLLHNKWKTDPQTGAVSVPIQHASTFHQFDFDTFGKYDYSRSGNPTREALEETIAALEGGVRGFAFSSGMAAISTAFLLLSKGDHVLVTEDVYGGTYRMITEVLSRFGIEYTFVDMTDLHEVASHIRPNTKVIYVETPSNPLLKVTDIRGIVKLAKANGCLTFLDNTFMTPALQRPLDLGVDVVLHSATKFLAGHSDVVAGLAVVKDEELAKQLYKLQNAFGAVLGVQDAWLVLRGLKTLHVRLKQSSESAFAIARYLASHPKVEEVFYPGLTHHPGHSVQRYQASGFGAVLSFRLADEEAARTFVKHVRIPVFAVSLGAVESILSYPAKMSHAAMPKEERERRGITDGLLRLSVGLEATDDLIADFEQALSHVKETPAVSAR